MGSVRLAHTVPKVSLRAEIARKGSVGVKLPLGARKDQLLDNSFCSKKNMFNYIIAHKIKQLYFYIYY